MHATPRTRHGMSTGNVNVRKNEDPNQDPDAYGDCDSILQWVKNKTRRLSQEISLRKESDSRVEKLEEENRSLKAKIAILQKKGQSDSVAGKEYVDLTRAEYACVNLEKMASHEKDLGVGGVSVHPPKTIWFMNAAEEYRRLSSGLTSEKRKAEVEKAMQQLHMIHEDSNNFDGTGIDAMLSSERKAFRMWILRAVLYHFENKQNSWHVALKIVDIVNKILKKHSAVQPPKDGYQWFYKHGSCIKDGQNIGYRQPTAAKHWLETANNVAGIESHICNDIAKAMLVAHGHLASSAVLAEPEPTSESGYAW